MKIRPLSNRVLVSFIEQGMRQLSSGIVLPDDDGRDHGIRPRWAKVFAVGNGVVDIQEGQWILIEHGRWTRGLTVKDQDSDQEFTLYQVDWKSGVLAVSDHEPSEEFDIH